MAGAKRPPNVIVILADDLGFNDITLNGGGVAGGAVPTPHIDAIARQGVNFANGYAGNATCSPSRAALMTGRYPTRFGFEFTAVPLEFSKVVGGHDVAGSPFRSIYHDSGQTAMRGRCRRRAGPPARAGRRHSVSPQFPNLSIPFPGSSSRNGSVWPQ